MGYFLMQNMHKRFCSAIISFCRASHSKGWMGKVLNCIKEKRTEWALWRWHKSRGESTINVNAFSVTSTSFLRPYLLLPTEGVNRFPRSLVPWTYLMPIITLRGFFCPLDVSLSVPRPDPSLPMLHFTLPFILQTLCGSTEDRALLEVWRDIFDGELLMNLPCALKGEKNAVWNFFLFFLSYIFIPSRPMEPIHSSESRAACRTCMHILYLNKSAVPAESSYSSLSH